MTQVACSTSGPLQLHVTAGTTYYFLLGSDTPRPTFSFSVQSTVPSSNDDISGATTMGTLPYSNQQDSLTATANPADPTPTCGAPNNFSVWYAFTSTSTGFLQATTGGGQGLAPTATAFSGPPTVTTADTLTQVACSTSGPLQLHVTAGTTYYFLLGSDTPRPTFSFSVQSTVPSSNDDISGATTMGTLPYSNQQDSLTATANPADPTPTCGAPNNFSVWYVFTSTSTGFLQATTGGGQGLAPTATAFSGPPTATTADTLTQVACSTSGPLQLHVTAGTTYYFLLGSDTPRPTFSFSVQSTVPSSNDDISGATTMGTLPYSNQQDSLTATANPADPTPTCGAPNNFSVWYAFTSTSTGFLQATTGGGQGLAPTATAFSGPPTATTADTLTQVVCSTSGPLQLHVTAGTTYYFLLGSDTPRPTFSFSVQSTVPSSNDDISGATAMGTLPYSNQQDSLTATANPADPTPTCGAPNNFSVWYAFTSTSTGFLQATTGGGQGLAPTATAFSGPPTATTADTLTQVACSTSGPLQLHVTAGTTYYFLLGSDTPRPTFSFSVQSTVPSSNDDISGATAMGTLPYSNQQDSLTATREPGRSDTDVWGAEQLQCLVRVHVDVHRFPASHDRRRSGPRPDSHRVLRSAHRDHSGHLDPGCVLDQRTVAAPRHRRHHLLLPPRLRHPPAHVLLLRPVDGAVIE